MRIYFLLMFLVATASTHAQVLHLDDAINQALKNHPAVKQAEQELAIAKLNRSAGMIGGMPVIVATINDQESNNRINQELFNGTKIKREGVLSNNLSGNATASMLLYQGGRIKSGMKRLEEQEKLQQDRLDAIQCNVKAEVNTAYFEVIRLQSVALVINEQIQLLQKQIEWVEAKMKAGLANREELYPIQIEQNNRLQEKQRNQVLIKQSMNQLFRWMHVEPDSMRTIDDSIVLQKTVTLEDVLNGLERNPELISLERQIRIRNWMEKEVKSNAYPALRMNAGMNYFRNQNAAGQLLLNQNSGPFVSMGLSIPLYASGAAKRAERISKIQTQQSREEKERVRMDLRIDLMNLHAMYLQSIDQINLQLKTVNLTSKQLELVMNRFRLGEATYLDLLEAQRNLEAASQQLIQLRHTAKTAEIEWLRMGVLR